MAKVKPGERYLNIHTGVASKVISTYFFTVDYVDLYDPQRVGLCHCHYKTFLKHWRMC